MEKTIQEAIDAIFGVSAGEKNASASPALAQESVPGQQPADTTSEAGRALRRAQQALEKGDWEGFGKAMQDLQDLLGEQQKNAP
jgi:uncharacterized membrane protein (UPF0182 family)